MTSYLAPPTMCYICQFPHNVYILLTAIFSQGKSDSVTQAPPPLCLCRSCCTHLRLHQESLNTLEVSVPFAQGSSPLPFRKDRVITLPLL